MYFTRVRGPRPLMAGVRRLRKKKTMPAVPHQSPSEVASIRFFQKSVQQVLVAWLVCMPVVIAYSILSFTIFMIAFRKGHNESIFMTVNLIEGAAAILLHAYVASRVITGFKSLMRYLLIAITGIVYAAVFASLYYALIQAYIIFMFAHAAGI